MFTVLSQLFVVERHRQRAGEVGFEIPALGEIVVEDPNIEPLLTTNMKGTFVRTRVSRDGYVRYGFSECSLDQEIGLLCEFCNVLILEGTQNGWNNTTALTPEVMLKPGFQSLIMASKFTDAYKEAKIQEGMKTFIADLPEGVMGLIAAQPRIAGFYTRIGDHVAILAQHVDTAFVMIKN